MNTLLDQLKQRRLDLKLTQEQIADRIYMTRQQYQRLEKQGNPRLDTLELLAAGLNLTLVAIPKEKLHEIQAVLDGKAVVVKSEQPLERIYDNPWKGLLPEYDDEEADDEEVGNIEGNSDGS